MCYTPAEDPMPSAAQPGSVAPALQLLPAEGDEPLDVADFGTVTAGATSAAVRLRVRNTGSAEAFFTRVRAAAHPSAQVGSAADTYAATEFAATEEGAYGRELELGTLPPGEEKAFWVRWVVPKEAPAGAVAWGVEVVGSST